MLTINRESRNLVLCISTYIMFGLIALMLTSFSANFILNCIGVTILGAMIFGVLIIPLAGQLFGWWDK